MLLPDYGSDVIELFWVKKKKRVKEKDNVKLAKQ